MGGYLSKTVYVESPNFSGYGERIEWCLKYHFRGFLGAIICIVYGSICGRFMNHPKNAVIIANVMTISYLLQPMSIPVTGMLPIFLIPMSGIMATLPLATLFFSANSCLIFMGGLMSFVLNNTGLDRRLITKILTHGNTPGSYKPNIFMFKVCIAAYFTSFFGNHLYTTATMYEYLEPVFAGFQVPPKPKKREKNDPPPPPREFQYHQFQHYVNEALLASANLGHLNMIHSSWTLTLLRHAYYGSEAPGSHQDLFNYLQYMMFSLIYTSTALCLTILYFVIVFKVINGKPMSAANENMMTKKFQEFRKNELVPLRPYQKFRNMVAVLLLIISFILFITRYSPWFSWSIIFRTKNVISDATVAAACIFILCSFPRHFGFLKIFNATKRSELNLKPETALLFWRFVDKAVNYGYLYVFAGSVIMTRAFNSTGVSKDLSELMRPIYDDSLGLFISLGAISLMSLVASNIGSPIAMNAAFLPFLLGSITGPARSAVMGHKGHLMVLVSTLSSSFNYLFPFRNTLSFHRNHLTRTKVKDVWLHAFILSIVHAVLLVVFVTFLGNLIWFQKIEEFPVTPPKK